VKKYKHIKTEHIAVLKEHDHFYHISDIDAYLPVEMIENSNDWVLVEDKKKEEFRNFKTKIEHTIDSIFESNAIFVAFDNDLDTLNRISIGAFKGEFFKRLKEQK
jgi:hypothetical protein